MPQATEPSIDQYPVPLVSKRRVSLYFLNEVDDTLITDSRELEIPRDSTPERTAMEVLLREPGPGFRSVAGEGWTCESIYIVRDASASNVNNIAFIDIGIDNMFEIDKIKTLRTACARTLEGMSKVNYVYMTVNGTLPEVFSNTPLESASVSEVAVGTPSLVYYPDETGTYAIPVVRMLQTPGASQDYMEALYQEMKNSSDTPQLDSNFPTEVVLDYEKIILPETPEEKNVVEIHLSGPLSVLENRDSMLMYNYCLGLTMLSSIPERDTIRIVYHPHDSVERSWLYTLEGSLNAKRGAFIPVYFANKENMSLRRVMRARGFETATNPISSVYEIIAGPSKANANILSAVMPDGVTDKDFLGYSIDGNIIVLNFSREFYEKCSGLDEREELYLVYSLVNAMTDHPSIEQVLFIRNGVGVNDMSGRIMLLQPLLRNPGLVR